MTHPFPTRRSSDFRLRNRRLLAARAHYQEEFHGIQRDGPQNPWRASFRPPILRYANPSRESLVRQLQGRPMRAVARSEEHTSELQSLMRISYAVLCLKNKIYKIMSNYRQSE